MDKEYWIKYYASQSPGDQPSDFAKFIASKHQAAFGKIIDIGCGNGRDTLYFASQGIPSIGIDQCEVAISKIEQKKNQMGLNAVLKADDFSACDYDVLSNGKYSIYSRFTLHAINYEEENRLFSHLNNGKNLSYLFIEARTIRDGIYGHGDKVGTHEYVTSHYRRFIDPEVLKKRLQENFTIEYFEEAQGFAKTPTEDPCLIRVIAKRK